MSKPQNDLKRNNGKCKNVRNWKTNFRTAASILLGVASFFVIYAGAAHFLEIIGIPTYISYKETVFIAHSAYDDEQDGSMTGAASALMFFSMVWAFRIAVLFKRCFGGKGISKSLGVNFNLIMVGLLLYGIFSHLLDLMFGYEEGYHQIIANILNIGLIIVIWGGLFLYKETLHFKQTSLYLKIIPCYITLFFLNSYEKLSGKCKKYLFPLTNRVLKIFIFMGFAAVIFAVLILIDAAVSDGNRHLSFLTVLVWVFMIRKLYKVIFRRGGKAK